jgi:hypothetical protein
MALLGECHLHGGRDMRLINVLAIIMNFCMSGMEARNSGYPDTKRNQLNITKTLTFWGVFLLGGGVTEWAHILYCVLCLSLPVTT